MTDEQRSRRPIFIATLWAGASWLFFRVARSTRMTQIWALRSRLEKQPTDLRQNTSYFGDRTLGHRFSGLVAIQPGHTLVTGGVYAVIRHPSYLGLLVNSLGWGLAFRSGVGVLLTALLILPVLARIRAEERLLRSQFGDEYDTYCARTSRLIPWLY